MVSRMGEGAAWQRVTLGKFKSQPNFRGKEYPRGQSLCQWISRHHRRASLVVWLDVEHPGRNHGDGLLPRDVARLCLGHEEVVQPEVGLYFDFILSHVVLNCHQSKYPIRHLDPHVPEVCLYPSNLLPREVDLPGHPVGIPFQAFGHHGGRLLLITFCYENIIK